MFIGTNTQGYRNHSACLEGSGAFVCNAVTVNPYTLLAGHWPYLCQGQFEGAAYAPVLGEVYRVVDEETHKTLDDLEEGYRKGMCAVRFVLCLFG